MNAIPEGFQTVTPTLVLKDAAAAITLYARAFGAKENYRLNSPDGTKIAHACIEIGTSKIFICDVNPNCMTASNSAFYLYLENVDTVFQRAKQAGMKEVMAPQDMFWGDRMGNLTDAFGVQWSVATHIRDVSPADLEAGMRKMMAEQAA